MIKKIIRYFAPRYVFKTIDIFTGKSYVTQKFWSKTNAMSCLMFHKKFEGHTDLAPGEAYPFEYTVFDIWTGEMIK